jgi:hypothetical protein
VCQKATIQGWAVDARSCRSHWIIALSGFVVFGDVSESRQMKCTLA